MATLCGNCGHELPNAAGPGLYCTNCGEPVTRRIVTTRSIAGEQKWDAETGEPVDDTLALLPYQGAEHEAWLDVVRELGARSVGQINAGEPDERLHDAIVRWGEELAQLRLHDPQPEHAERALAERREKWGATTA